MDAAFHFPPWSDKFEKLYVSPYSAVKGNQEPGHVRNKQEGLFGPGIGIRGKGSLGEVGH